MKNPVIPKDDALIKDLIEKDYAQFLKPFIRSSMEGMVTSTYDLIRACYVVELTGAYKKDGYEDFETWLIKETLIGSYSQFRNYLIVAKNCSKFLIDRVGFQILAVIESLPLLENHRETLIEQLEHDIEMKDTKLSKKEILAKAKTLMVKKEKQSELSKLEEVKLKLREAKKIIVQKNQIIAELQNRINKLEMKCDDQARMIEEFQRGERPI